MNLKTRVKALENREAAQPPKPPQVVIFRPDSDLVEIDFREVITQDEYYRRYPGEKPGG